MRVEGVSNTMMNVSLWGGDLGIEEGRNEGRCVVGACWCCVGLVRIVRHECLRWMAFRSDVSDSAVTQLFGH